MPQISLYIDEETLKKVEKAAKKEHISISKWVGNNIKSSFEKEYPEGYFKLAGSIKDDSMVAERPAVYNTGIKEENHSSVLNIGDIDTRILKSLKNAAKIDQTSVSNEIIMIVESYFNKRNTVENNTAEWLKLAGSWEDSRTAEEIIADLKNSRTENKRFEDGLFD